MEVNQPTPQVTALLKNGKAANLVYDFGEAFFGCLLEAGTAIEAAYGFKMIGGFAS